MIISTVPHNIRCTDDNPLANYILTCLNVYLRRNNIMYAGKKMMCNHKGRIYQMNINQGFYYYFHFVYICVYLRVCLPSNM